MKASVFVCASACVFSAWLAVTFLRDVPAKDYPTLGRGSVPISAKRDAREPAEKPAPAFSLDGKPHRPVARTE